MQVVIRPYEDRDLEETAHLWFESWRSTGLAVAKQATEAALRRRIPQELASQWSAYLARDEDDHLLGFLALRPNIGRLDQIFVSPAEQRQGVGLALRDFAQQQRPKGFW